MHPNISQPSPIPQAMNEEYCEQPQPKLIKVTAAYRPKIIFIAASIPTAKRIT
jgi:hypothetical protein